MQVDAGTGLYGIIGKPVGHSLSPAMHNAAFESQGINAVYLAFETDSPGKALEAVRTLGIRGLSVTVPNKEGIITFLDKTDETAATIGAVNTVKNSGGRLTGINTDWIGAVEALRTKTDLKGKRAIVLGAGGSARAVVFGLLSQGAHVHIANRTIEKAKDLAGEFGCSFSGLEDFSRAGGDILINTTSVGMGELAGVSPVPEAELGRFRLVMDIVYGGTSTRLLLDAERKGCSIVSGKEMLLFQAAGQFEFWTGLKAPAEVMKRALLRAQEGII